MTGKPDLKKPPRLRDAGAMKRYHEKVGYCELMGPKCIAFPRSVHHVLLRSRGGDDVEANFVMVCGSGTTGEHGLLTVNDPATLDRLYDHLMSNRPDTLAYLATKLGDEDKAADFLERTYLRA